MKKFLLTYLFLFAFISCDKNPSEELVTITGRTMGTTYSVKYLDNSTKDIEEVKADITRILKTVNAQMSTYIPSSELSKFNSVRDTSWYQISYDLAFVINKSLEICKLSGGALDITVGPIVNLWGFGPDNKPTAIPSDSAINEALKSVGWHNIKVSLDPPRVKKKLPEIYCDLSSTAKGFGVDKVSGYLSSLGVDNYLVEIGGELKARGKKLLKQKWRVGIAKPDNNATVQEIIILSNSAMATSGDYWNYFEENGVRYSHTVDPTTGRPITHKLASITVIAESCLMADGLATAMDVMGDKKGYQFALDNNLPAYFIVRNNGEFVVNYTDSFRKFIVKD